MKLLSPRPSRKGDRLLALGLAIALAACGRNITAESDEAMTLAFTQRDSLGHVTAELGTFTVIPTMPASLQGALKAEVSIEGYGESWTTGRASGDPARDVIVFFLVIGPKGAEGYIQAGAGRALVRNGPVETEPTGHVPDLPRTGTVHAFFIAGIGDPPDGPVEILLRGTSAIQRLVIDSTHTLALTPAFTLNETQVLIQPDTAAGLSLGLNFGPSPGASAHPYPGPTPLYVWKTRSGVDAGVAGAGLRTGTGLPHPPEFDFRLYFIAP